MEKQIENNSEHSPEEQKLISKIMLLKPEGSMDEQFASRLKRKLVSTQLESKTYQSPIINLSNYMKKFNLAVGAVAIVAILVVSTVLTKQDLNFNISTEGVKITSAGERAFGELVNVTGSGRGGGNAATAVSDSQELAVPTASSPETKMAAPGFGGGTADLTIAPYEPINYKYVYSGEPLILDQTKLDVLRRLKGNEITSDIQGLVSVLGFGLVDLNGFGNLKLQYATLAQDNNGYTVSVDAVNSMISINAPYEAYAMDSAVSASCPVSDAGIRPECLPMPPPVKIEDMPDDTTLINAANDFVRRYNINMSAYAEPIVQNDWRTYYDLAADKSTAWIPEVATVVYPLKVNEHMIFDEGGNPTGLMVSINVRTKKVANLYELSVQNYQSSSYDAETDVARILGIIERGGIYGYVDPSATKTVEIELGAPKIEYVKMWNYVGNQSHELLVPSLIFPILNAPTDEKIRKNVVVPLIKEILDNGNFGGPIRIMEEVQPASNK